MFQRWCLSSLILSKFLCRTFQIGHEKFHVPWLYVINRKSSEVPLIDFHLVSPLLNYHYMQYAVELFLCAYKRLRLIIQKYTGNDLLGVTAKVVDMPHHCT